ncbi:MAG: hypothetical protein LV481_10395 [Methylacidiphilales bacterium]|nr:hypothetical protein [Candidatus Methylacidiphilales bacterium]
MIERWKSQEIFSNGAGRNSDNTFIKDVLKWEPGTPLDKGLAVTYRWIGQQYQKRKAGERVHRLMKNQAASPVAKLILNSRPKVDIRNRRGW